MNLKKCPVCSNYMLSEICHSCKAKTKNPHPMKFSSASRYARYRPDIQNR